MPPIHPPEWHILDSAFPESGRGLVPPARCLSSAGAALRILNLDPSDPPSYTPGGYPRGPFNRNLFALTPAPAMPVIPVECATAGFDPAQTPIEWRLLCRHILCRHTNSASYRYRGAVETFDREWRGQSRSNSFRLFSPDCPCTYNDPGRVLGGHALLMVAVRLPQSTLLDYVHLRISGANPAPPDVLRYLDTRLSGYDPNIAAILRAAFRQESNFRQFSDAAQTASVMTFTRVHHPDPVQPDCRVRFDFPDDPPGFPLASFDFGVGISQWTEVGAQRVTADIAWDWRENVRLGANHLLAAVARSYKPGFSWQQVARAAWTLYNGSGPAAAAYAARLAASPGAAAIAAATAPLGLRDLPLLPPPQPLPAPLRWIVS